MQSLFDHTGPVQTGYIGIYQILSELRENFHRTGRLDDSNAKLDEVAKIFATYLAYKTGQISTFPMRDAVDALSELRNGFLQTARLPQYQLASGNTVFGTNPDLAIHPGDEGTALLMTDLVRQGIDLSFTFRASGAPFDVLNEAFGHFIRDNFRGNIEDAQYMTPPEVTGFVAKLALREMNQHGLLKKDSQEPITILDPACGVGSFLASIYELARNNPRIGAGSIRLFGQDKVERMVRLATINAELFDVHEYHISLGNSLELGSSVDALNGRVDIILTNPPFGAKFSSDYVRDACGQNTPFFYSLRRASRSVSSEFLFVDRGLQLLRDDGHMFIVVPNHLISAKGFAALLRQHIALTATVRSIIELPSVTFAQAGTRTKTAVLHIQKGRRKRQQSVFLATAKQIGFTVSSRKGVQIKAYHDQNDLLDIAERYVEFREDVVDDTSTILSAEPACLAVPELDVLRGSWSPSHRSAASSETISKVADDQDFRMVPLKEMATFWSSSRRPEPWTSGSAFISVRHIFGEGLLNVEAVLSYSPKTPGFPIHPGELLVSRINPQIPRICVVPDLGVKLLCSSEFEIMHADENTNIYLLAYLLHTRIVQNQIKSLTSGTSASHNRIRTSDLKEVLVPITKPGTRKAVAILNLAEDYRHAVNSLAENSIKVARLRQREASVFDS